LPSHRSPLVAKKVHVPTEAEVPVAVQWLHSALHSGDPTPKEQLSPILAKRTQVPPNGVTKHSAS
jgi:hypothetical protein